ncbi:DUF1611 domain-containing protein [Parasalinivibrio latis]|uniref:DUF1611 domain-containing protein n=1 Tax=Parasalinivibrio latis TaxID=2952610 RepID=UPI0030E30F90
MEITGPYLLFLGDVTDPLAVKTARGVLQWRPEKCVAQYRMTPSTVSLGIPDMTFEQAKEAGANTLVLGTANAGGFIPDAWVSVIVEAISVGFNVVSGMHKALSAVEAIAHAAAIYGVDLIDIRHFKGELAVGSGKKRTGKRLLTVGTDCSVGKMYTALSIHEGLSKAGVDTQFCATGQTGILIEGTGIAVDAVVADFISGATEQLSPACDPNTWQIIEGQGSVLNPAYAGVSVGLLHGAQPDALVLCHEVNRPHTRHMPHIALPDIDEIMATLLKLVHPVNPNAKFIAFSLNTSALEEDEALKYCQELESHYGIPATDPLRFTYAPLVDAVLSYQHGEQK